MGSWWGWSWSWVGFVHGNGLGREANLGHEVVSGLMVGRVRGVGIGRGLVLVVGWSWPRG